MQETPGRFLGWEDFLEKGQATHPSRLGPPECTSKARDMRDMGLILGLGRSPGEGNVATLTSILAWRIPWTEEPGRLQSMESQRVGHQ